MKTLSPRAEAFIENVVAGMSHVDAARAAGFVPNGDPRSYASVLYSKLQPEIEARRLKACVAAQAVVDLSIHSTLLTTWHHAHYDPRRVMSWGPDGVKVHASETLHPEEAKLVKEASCVVTEHVDERGNVTKRTTRTRVVLVDRQAALHRLAEYQGLTAGDPNLGLRIPGSNSAKDAEDADADLAKLAEELREIPTEELMRSWREDRAAQAKAKASDRLPVPA